MALVIGSSSRLLQTAGGIPTTGGTFTGAVLFADGTAAAPSIAFSSDADGSGTGFYRYGVNQIGVAINGVFEFGIAGGNPVAFFTGGDDFAFNLGGTNFVVVRNNSSAQMQFNNNQTKIGSGNVDGNLLLTNNAGNSGYTWKLISDGLVALADRAGTGNANLRLGTSALTAGTLTATNSAEVRTTIHRYDWTNAMVTALGAVTTGDITAFTLPAKTVVTNAYVVLTGAAAGPATVTVSLGRTGAAYIDYIVASDAKAAANTVYGDASGERGTNQTGYDLPSFTGTTAVKLQFISTGANLDTVTASTGTVYLETYTLP